MAINKNFVIKNGVEVNTNLLVGDSTLNKVGIATTVPGYTLHIGVGDGARGGIGVTDITVTGIATIGVANSTSGALSVTGISTFEGLVDANGGVSARTAAVQDLTDNRVVIAGSGGELEDSANLTFDGSTLTVSGDLDPTNVSIASTLQVAGIATFLSGIRVSGIATVGVLTVTGGAVVGGDLIVEGDYVVDEISARNLTLTGIATIPTLAVTGIGTFEKLTVGTGVTLQEHGGVSIAGITTANQGVRVNADSGNSSAASATNYFSVGASEDLKIYHNGGTNYIAAPNGDIQIKSDNFQLVSDDSSGRAIFLDNSNSRLELGFDGNHDAHYTGSGIDFLNDVDIDDTTQSTSTTTGALKVDGGVGVAKNLNVGGETVLQAVRIAGVSTISNNVNISGVTTTGENLGGFKRLVGAASSTVVSIAVTVAAKTADHRYFGQGSGNGYWLDGVQSPFLTLVPGKLYYFDQSHSTNANHPLRFYIEQDKANAYTTEITTGGTPGSSGAYTQIGIGTASNENNHPAVLHYQCSSHALMGNAVATQSNAVNLPDSVVTTVRGNLMPGADSSYDIGSNGVRFQNIYGDTLYGDGSNLTSLPSQVSIANNADNRVITGGSGVNLNGEANLTFDGSTLGITGSIDLSADIDVDGTANLDVLDVDGASNFGADVVFAGAAANITFDQSEDDLKFDDAAGAIFGAGADLKISSDGTHGILLGNGSGEVKILQGSDNSLKCFPNGAVELFHDGVKMFQTTGAGVTVGLSSIQHNGNAAFPGITTLGKPGAGSEVIINNRLTVNSGANITGISTLANAYIAKLVQSNGDSGQVNEVPVANGSGGWNWAPVNTAGASDIQGITVQEEGSNVGTAGSIKTINFTGTDITASASGQTATVNVSSTIQGITTSGTSFLHDITQTGVTTITSDQAAAFNVGTAATIYSNGNVRTTGVITAFGGFDVGAGTTAKIFSNGNANFSGIVTAGSGFNIGIQSAGIVIANNVGINTLNFVGSGNSITYFPATNTLDVSIAGSSGGGGGVSETSTSVSSTSPTSCGSFAKASKRSASVLAQITQGSAYQVGRYLVIHDGTTVTTVEESAVATGSMLGTFEGVINGNDVEFRVTMSSSSSATVITKIDSISS